MRICVFFFPVKTVFKNQSGNRIKSGYIFIDEIQRKEDAGIFLKVKYKNMKHEELSKSLRHFILKYNPERAYIVNLKLNKTVEIGKTEVCFLSPFKLLSISF